MKRKLVYSCLALVLGTAAGYATSVLAQAKPDVLVKQRQAVMLLQSKYFYGSLRPMAQGKLPWDPKTVARDVSFLEALSQMPWDGFHPSTKGVTSRAEASVFTEAAKFKETYTRYESEVAKLVSVSKGGDEAATKAQVLAVDKLCSGCHSDFRGK